MRAFAAFLAAVASLAAAAANPSVELSVAPTNVMVTESAEATIRILSPVQFRSNPSLAADFIPKGARLSMEGGRAGDGSSGMWRYTLRVRIPADRPGTRVLGPVTVSIPTRTDFFGFVSRAIEIKSGTATLEVEEPPQEGRPASYCGAIASDFSARALLDSNICTAGDPLMFTLELSGAADAAMVHAPQFRNVFRGSPFKLDEASLKTETLAASKRFTWRVRAVKAGTLEFPPVEVAWFDVRSRRYRVSVTAPIPVQVKAGEQAALGMLDETGDSSEGFPPPDGIELPFAPESFTLKHAVTLALRAESEKDFSAAADRYGMFIDSACAKGAAGRADGLPHIAVHWSNLGSLLVMAGRPREALDAFAKAERCAGSTPATVRGIRAARARLLNDPRADLPLPRIMFPFWFAMPMKWRIVSAVCAVAAFALLFLVAMRAGRGLSAIAVACGFALSAAAWPFGRADPFAGFFDDMPTLRSMAGSGASPVKAKAWFNTTVAMVGEPVELAVSVDPGSVRMEPGSVKVEAVFPDPVVEGRMRAVSPGVYGIPVSFLESGTNIVDVYVSGAYSGTYCVTNGNMISSGRVVNQPFRIKLKPAEIAIAPLPRNGRPLDFTGAVGTGFSLSQKLAPEAVHPGDLVTAEYRLEFKGYCPSNAAVRVENLSREFKAYELKEISRDANSVVWRQILVPRTTQATNSALVSFNFFNPRTKSYGRAVARPAALSFVSAEAASTENTKVLVNASAAAEGDDAKGTSPAAVTLRFAPNAKSPVLAILPRGTPVRETGRFNGWVRLESRRGAGWVAR